MKIKGSYLKDNTLIIVVLIFIYLLSGIFGCGKDEKKEINNITKETIRISGAWALYPMMVKWGEEFNKKYPHIRLDISAGGAGKGVADALSNLVDIGMVSRDLKPEEIKQGAFFIPVVKDAVFPTINSNNPDLYKILEKGVKKEFFLDLWINGKTLTWGDISGSNSKEKIQVYTRSDSCGAAETWANYLGKKNQEDLKGIAVYGDPGLADAVKKDKYGIGFNNLNYAFDAKTGKPVQGLNIIPIDINGDGKVDPKEDINTKQKAINAVASGIYPSPPARELYLVTKKGYKGSVKVFLEWILTEGQMFVEEAGYIKLSDRQIKKAIEIVNK